LDLDYKGNLNFVLADGQTFSVPTEGNISQVMCTQSTTTVTPLNRGENRELEEGETGGEYVVDPTEREYRSFEDRIGEEEPIGAEDDQQPQFDGSGEPLAIEPGTRYDETGSWAGDEPEEAEDTPETGDAEQEHYQDEIRECTPQEEVQEENMEEFQSVEAQEEVQDEFQKYLSGESEAQRYNEDLQDPVPGKDIPEEPLEDESQGFEGTQIELLKEEQAQEYAPIEEEIVNEYETVEDKEVLIQYDEVPDEGREYQRAW
jgi:hypothetical protein